MNIDNVAIPTYVVNLKSRPDRLAHIKREFENKPEFNIKFIEAITHKIGSYGLYLSLRKVIETAQKNEDDVIIFVEDDHFFTKYYSWEYLLKNIIIAGKQETDILLGGIGGGFRSIIPIAKNRFWIDAFWCTQFVVIYKPFFSKILNTNFVKGQDVIDEWLSKLTNKKATLFPFISEQKNFGYSDITTQRNRSISEFFEYSRRVFTDFTSKAININPKNKLKQL